MTPDARRWIPRTDDAVDDPRLAEAMAALGRHRVKEAVRQAQEHARAGSIEPESVVEVASALLPRLASSLRSVVNATGVIVHTNLGRAPLSAAARLAVTEAAGTTNVEFDLGSGARSRRGRGALEALAAAVPSAGDVHVVNNNAAALLLCALTLAPGREIVLSHGEFVEVGDGFRIPELLVAAGARLREVGATNRTSFADYRDAVGPETGLVLKVHPSNFHVSGFTATADIRELATLGVPVVVDIGSGLLAHDAALPDEPDAGTALREGASVVTASADKLLGGPQAGLLFGAPGIVERLRRHPAARALRVDKLTLAALEATLTGPTPPVRAALTVPTDKVRARAEHLVSGLADVDAVIVPTRAVVGGGGAPGVELDSVALSLPASFVEPLRKGEPPVVGRVEQQRCLLDLRSVEPSDDDRVRQAIETVAKECTS